MPATVTTTGLAYPGTAAAALNNVQWTIAAGTGDIITGAYNPPVLALTEGLILGARINQPNVTTTPTFSPDQLPAAIITARGGQPLQAADLPGGGFEALFRYSVPRSRWELLNPAGTQGGSGGGTSATNVYELVSFMNSHYGAGNWTQRLGPHAGTDIGPALSDALTVIKNTTGRGTVHIPAGNWYYKTAVPSSLLNGCKLRGDGAQATIVTYDNASGVAFFWNGANGFSGGGISGMTIELENGLGSTTATAIALIGNAAYQPDNFQIEDIYTTSYLSTDYWFTGVQIDGTTRTGIQGIRVGTIKNLQIFQCQNLAFYGANLVQWTIENMGSYTGKPSTTGMDMQITGLGAANTNSIYVSAYGLDCGGDLILTNCSNVWVNGHSANMFVNSSATYINGFMGQTVLSGTAGTGSNLVCNP